MLLAFEGWNDAGEAATEAVSFIARAVQSVPLADIDPEEYYDFTVRRPETKVVTDGGEPRRTIDWPANEFRFGTLDGSRTVVLGVGVEPHLRWRSFCDCVVAVARRVGVRRVVLVGSYLADVVYSRPVVVSGLSSDLRQLDGIEVEASTYEGPTGIVGVLVDRFEREGLEVVSLWAALPHYITASPNPRGALALVEKLCRCVDFRIDVTSLAADAAQFEEKIAKLVASDRELAEYVRQLKRREFAQ